MAPGAGLRLFIVHAPADAWFVEGFLLEARPGADPTTALAGVLEATATERSDPAMQWLGDAVGRLLANHPDHRLLIVVDQLEELFATAGPDARAGFVSAVRALRGDARVAIVLTLRADFYASLMESALWADLDGGSRLAQRRQGARSRRE